MVDAKFEPSQAPEAFDADEHTAQPMAMTEVLLSLVDSQGNAVGRPSWCRILDVLNLLAADMVLTPEVRPRMAGTRDPRSTAARSGRNARPAERTGRPL